MTVAAAVKFLEATSTDASARAKLVEIIGVGDGDVSDAAALDQDEAQALLGERAVLVAQLAGQLGYDFSVAELASVVEAFQRHRAGEISETELTRILGPSASNLAAIGKDIGMVFLGVRYNKRLTQDKAPQVIQFIQKTAQDEKLRDGLKAILQTGDGDISSFAELDGDEAQALLGARGALVAEFAARHGFAFTMADLFAVMDAFRRLKDGELTEDAFAKYSLSGGNATAVLPFIQDVAEYTYKGVSYRTPIPSAAQASTVQVVRFMEKSRDDAALAAELQSLIGGDGNISAPGELDAAEASLIGARSSRIVELAAKHGFHFTVADLSAVVGAFQLVEAGGLPLDACMRILGMKQSEDRAVADLAAVASTAGRIYRGVRY
jgi:hypothetical protein